MSGPQTSYLKCPQCQASLPDWSKSCQFCGADTSRLARPVREETKKHYATFDTPKWIWACYYLIAAWWILGGVFDVLNGFYVFGKPLELLKLEKEFNITASPMVIDIITGTVTACFGIGLAVKLEMIRGIVNVIAGLKLARSLLGLAGTLLGMTFSGVLGIPFMLMHLFNIITSGMLIWLIGETDMKPNWS